MIKKFYLPNGRNMKVKKGFSLVETLVAVSIFAIASVLIAGVFSGFLKNSVEARKSQKSMESARYAMDLMAKTLRTSVIDTVTPAEIRVFDNTQGTCVIYRYDSVNKKMLTGSSAQLANLAACAGVWNTIVVNDLTPAGNIDSANFVGGVGIITIVLGVPSKIPNNYLSKIQTTVSLRQ